MALKKKLGGLIETPIQHWKIALLTNELGASKNKNRPGIMTIPITISHTILRYFQHVYMQNKNQSHSLIYNLNNVLNEGATTSN